MNMTTRKQIETLSADTGKRARERRESQRMPQAHISTVMNRKFGFETWQQTTVAKVEAGERSLRLTEAVALASILDMALAELVGESTDDLAARELRNLRTHIDARLKELG
jgi:transcriptional regulator with XRE-family HTH domain